MPTILCIDDIPQVLLSRKALLETRGYEVLTADDGPCGIEVARRYPINAVLLDYDLPGMMGDEVAVILKREHPKLPIVILTGFAWASQRCCCEFRTGTSTRAKTLPSCST